MLKQAAANHLAHSHSRPSPGADAGPAARSAEAQPVFFVCFGWRHSRANRPTRSLLPRAQAATWAWAGKARPRLGRKRPSFVSGQSQPLDEIQLATPENPSQSCLHPLSLLSVSLSQRVDSREPPPQAPCPAAGPRPLPSLSSRSSSPARAARSSENATAAARPLRPEKVAPRGPYRRSARSP